MRSEARYIRANDIEATGGDGTGVLRNLVLIADFGAPPLLLPPTPPEAAYPSDLVFPCQLPPHTAQHTNLGRGTRAALTGHQRPLPVLISRCLGLQKQLRTFENRSVAWPDVLIFPK